MTGASMGGHVTAVSIEKYQTFYDGALPVCGVVGDFELFDFFLDFNVAAQQIGLGTSQFPVDPAYPVVTAPQIKANLEAVPGGWPLVLNAEGQGFKQLVELRSGGDRPNFDEAWFFWNSFPEFGSGIPGNFLFDLGATDGTLPGHPGVMVDNSDVIYQTDLDPALSSSEQELNANIVRVHADPAARRSHANPAVTGNISVPVLTMHNLGDLFVPFHNEIAYAEDVAGRGNSHLLVQRAIRGVGHCGFTTLEYETAFADLISWVEDGLKPAGDVVTDPAVVAGADYGCQFTDFATPDGHLLPVPCP
jgi:pimeloyl-ACP methyl ester carboxylesterase